MTVSSGLAMEIHYCMGKLAGVDFHNNDKNDKCGRCGMKENKEGCCKDEHKFYKLDGAYKNVSNDLDFNAPVKYLITDNWIFNQDLTISDLPRTPNNHSPPIYQGSSRCILHCVFRL